MKSTRLAAVVHDSLPDTSRITSRIIRGGRIVHAARSVDTLIFRTSATARSLEMSAIHDVRSHQNSSLPWSEAAEGHVGVASRVR